MLSLEALREVTVGGVKSPTSKKTLKLSNAPKSVPPFCFAATLNLTCVAPVGAVNSSVVQASVFE